MAEATLKIRDLVARWPSIPRLREAPKTRAKLAFELSALAGPVTAVLRNYEETRGKLFKQLAGDNVNKDGVAEIPAEHRAEFAAQLEELLDKDVVLKVETVYLPANFEMDGLVGILADWPEFLVVKE